MRARCWTSAIPGRLDERVRDRIVAETRGNPLALLELPRGLTPAELAGGFGLPDARPLASRIEQSFLRRLESLPAETQRLLLVAAAEPVGDVDAAVARGRAARDRGRRGGAGRGRRADRARRPGAVPPSAGALGGLPGGGAARPPGGASRAGRGDRSASSIPIGAPGIAPTRRPGPTRTVAAELERSADRAQGRGGVAAAAAFLRAGDRADARSGAGAARGRWPPRRPSSRPARRTRRTSCSRPRRWARSTSSSAHGWSGCAPRSRSPAARGSDAPPLLLDAAKRLEPLDAGLARETYLEALGAAIFAGRLSGGRGVREVAEAARAAPPAPQPPRAIDLLLDGLATRFTEGYAAGVPPLRRALQRVRATRTAAARTTLRWLWLACRVAADLWDDEAWHELATRAVRLAREAGALTVLRSRSPTAPACTCTPASSPPRRR